METIIVREAAEPDSRFAEQISTETELSAIARGSGIAKRSPQSIIEKIKLGNAVIAVTPEGAWAGYAYLEGWSAGEFVSSSGLIVSPAFRNQGVARMIKEKIMELAQKKFPEAKIFSITTGLAIMKMNSAPVSNRSLSGRSPMMKLSGRSAAAVPISGSCSKKTTRTACAPHCSSTRKSSAKNW